tara:strand:+ start:217 stop:657 length:441 start_codon:yes stop_codon:yes gene_type:complete
MYSYNDLTSSLQDIKTCLQPSLIEGAGVGVFALRFIKQDEVLYDKKYWNCFKNYQVHWKDVKKLVEPKIEKYIERMCMYVPETESYILDVPLNMLYTEYYINHSHTPNLFWDRKTHEFFAIQDIEEGEELTSYYRPDERDWEFNED